MHFCVLPCFDYLVYAMSFVFQNHRNGQASAEQNLGILLVCLLRTCISWKVFKEIMLYLNWPNNVLVFKENGQTAALNLSFSGRTKKWILKRLLKQLPQGPWKKIKVKRQKFGNNKKSNNQSHNNTYIYRRKTVQL